METDTTEATVKDEMEIRYTYPKIKALIKPKDYQQANHLKESVRQCKEKLWAGPIIVSMTYSIQW